MRSKSSIKVFLALFLALMLLAVPAVVFADELNADSDAIDSVAPTTNLRLSPEPNSNGWNNTDVTVNLSATDNEGGSGVNQVVYSASGAENISAVIVNGSSAAVNLTAEGTTTVRYFAVDNDGNAETAKTVTVNIDKTYPNANGATTNRPNAKGWFNQDVIVHFSGDDDVSGIWWVSPDVILSSEGQSLSARGIVTDKAGNSISISLSGINIDKTGPSVELGAALPAANSAGWNNSEVSIPFTASDALSGLATAGSGTVILSSEGSSVTGQVTATDLAGNSTTFTSPAVKIDKTAPTFTVSQPVDGAVYVLGQMVPANYTAADALSGVNSISGTAPVGSNIDTSSVGTKKFTVTSMDQAGNSSSEDIFYNVVYRITLLFDNTSPGTGAVTQIKLQLLDEANTNVSSEGLVVHAVAVKQAGADVDIPVQSNGNAYPNNDFRYRASLGDSGGYIFGLRTADFASGTYLLNFTVGDEPTVYTVQFEVR